MKLLLDTHALIWYLNSDTQLSNKAKQAIENSQYIKYLSIGSLWEMSIKIKLGKLDIGLSLAEFKNALTNKGLTVLNLAFSHIDHLQNLPTHHNDPFDRLLIAQAFVEDMTIVSADTKFPAYDVPLIW